MDQHLKLGSLFDGSGGFPLAGTLCGIEPVWASEVEPYPIAVTKSRFPNMKHLGDISKVNGAGIEPVDIVTFGSPCQGLSQAGLRLGLADNRSCLFMEAVRIIKKMRRATNGIYPNFAIWENVPGAFSSNKGEDFRVVLEELIKIVEPHAVMPPVPPHGWAYADSYSGDGWSLAYRVFDAQYWGVPQRRRRIYLVLDLRGERAEKVLFERDGVRGYFAEGRTPWQATSADAERGVGADDRAGAIDKFLFENHGQDARYKGPLNVSPMLSAKLGTGGNNQPLVMETFCKSARARSADDATTWKHSKVANTLNTFDMGEVRTNELVVEGEPVYYIVRRLTPTECARLQGFPDWWGWIKEKESLTDDEYRFWMNVRNTYASINGKIVRNYTDAQMLTWYNKLWTDSAEYKMWGNGIALPNALYVMQGIADVMEEQTSRRCSILCEEQEGEM